MSWQICASVLKIVFIIIKIIFRTTLFILLIMLYYYFLFYALFIIFFVSLDIDIYEHIYIYIFQMIYLAGMQCPKYFATQMTKTAPKFYCHFRSNTHHPLITWVSVAFGLALIGSLWILIAFLIRPAMTGDEIHLVCAILLG